MSPRQEEFFEDAAPQSVQTVVEEIVSDDEIQADPSETDGSERRGRKKGKTAEKKERGGKGLAAASKLPLIFEMDEYERSYHLFQEALHKINNKSIGREIAPEEILEMLIDRIDHDLVLELQKKSLTEDEMNLIFRQHFTQFPMEQDSLLNS